MPWGTSASNTLKINKITIISFFTLCRNTTISFHNFVELIPVFKIYLYLCRIDYSLNNIITMKKRHYGMLSLALTSCLAVHAENKNQNTECFYKKKKHAKKFKQKTKIKIQTSPMLSSSMLMI